MFIWRNFILNGMDFRYFGQCGRTIYAVGIENAAEA
jgi:hypothetical protein